MAEVGERPSLEQSLENKAKKFGLSEHFIKEIPLPIQKLLNRLDKLGNAYYEGKRVSMLDESLLSAAIIEQNPDLVNESIGSSSPEELELMQRDLIRGTLISDIGKAANSEMIWLYYKLNLKKEVVEARLPKFLLKKYEMVGTYDFMDLPYSVAVELYKDIEYGGNDLKAGSWVNDRDACEKKLKNLGFNIAPSGRDAFDKDESTLHDVLTGAHLAELPKILKDSGVGDDPDWERAICIAENHHLSRGLVNGLPIRDKSKGYLTTIYGKYSVAMYNMMELSLFEELLDSTIAAFYRDPRLGDNHGTNALKRLNWNLNTSEKKGRITHDERALIEEIAESLYAGQDLSASVVERVKSASN